MSNDYPPGVTGHELQISGPDWEGRADVTCDNGNATLIAVTTKVALLLANLKDADNLELAVPYAARLRRTLKAEPVVEVEGVECPFNGPVDAWTHGRTLHWECPVCGVEHEEDEAEEDPDEARDRWLDMQEDDVPDTQGDAPEWTL